MKKLLILPLVATLVGCQSMGERETIGTLGGAALGGLVGAQFGDGSGRAITTAVGIMGGALIGRGIGQELDRADQDRHARTFHTALEHNSSGSIKRWQNPNNQTQGYVVPQRTYQTSSGKYCREYQTSITIGNQTQNGYGTACRQPDGSWRIQE